jgi:hypothetical protein
MECPTPLGQNFVQCVNMASINFKVRVGRKFLNNLFTGMPLVENSIELNIQVRIVLKYRMKTDRGCY